MQFKTRKLIKSEDLNGINRLFGGRLLQWIDEESAIYAMCQLETKSIVTKAISNINFENPAFLNDVIEIGLDVVKFGITSITVKVVVRNKDTKNNILTIDEIVFVHIDINGKPTPHNKTKK
jgi:acyl-CoA thioesterase YciA